MQRLTYKDREASNPKINLQRLSDNKYKDLHT